MPTPRKSAKLSRALTKHIETRIRKGTVSKVVGDRVQEIDLPAADLTAAMRWLKELRRDEEARAEARRRKEHQNAGIDPDIPLALQRAQASRSIEQQLAEDLRERPRELLSSLTPATKTTLLDALLEESNSEDTSQ